LRIGQPPLYKIESELPIDSDDGFCKVGTGKGTIEKTDLCTPR
jgi:hypothetical protein